MFDEMTLLTNVIAHSIKDGCLFVCVSAKDYGYKFFNLNSTDEMIQFASHLAYIQLNTDIPDVFICSVEEKSFIEKSETEKAINLNNNWWHYND